MTSRSLVTSAFLGQVETPAARERAKIQTDEVWPQSLLVSFWHDDPGVGCTVILEIAGLLADETTGEPHALE
jgi:hypothetical protein